MQLTRVISFIVALAVGFSGVAAVPAASAGMISSAEKTLSALDGNVKSASNQINDLINSGQATANKVAPILNSLVTDFHTAETSLASAGSHDKRQLLGGLVEVLTTLIDDVVYTVVVVLEDVDAGLGSVLRDLDGGLGSILTATETDVPGNSSVSVTALAPPLPPSETLVSAPS
ncbi:hypothetical protein OE88DRAFT_1662210 [Heliocybe sulcata]|uniref:Hydrophobic surface binding protein A n=1 Tax=Heliocybe sulcata TaxID=5364 RepID=A0A5C3MXR5_9AGAM|nr:hypothetical protein OE88DRAFT_1662210 [Heliocybe sulcata]